MPAPESVIASTCGAALALERDAHGTAARREFHGVRKKFQKICCKRPASPSTTPSESSAIDAEPNALRIRGRSHDIERPVDEPAQVNTADLEAEACRR